MISCANIKVPMALGVCFAMVEERGKLSRNREPFICWHFDGKTRPSFAQMEL